jgi:hypothetical protein
VGTNLEQVNQRIASETTETLLHMIRQNMEPAELQRTMPAQWEAADEDIRIVRWWGHAVFAGKRLNELRKRVNAEGGDWLATLRAHWPAETARGNIELLMEVAEDFDW